jgi:hypothetical protein
VLLKSALGQFPILHGVAVHASMGAGVVLANVAGFEATALLSIAFELGRKLAAGYLLNSRSIDTAGLNGTRH